MCTTQSSLTPVQTLWQAKRTLTNKRFGQSIKGKELKFLVLVNHVILFRAGNI